MDNLRTQMMAEKNYGLLLQKQLQEAITKAEQEKTKQLELTYATEQEKTKQYEIQIKILELQLKLKD